MKKIIFIFMALSFLAQGVFALEDLVDTYSEKNKFGLIQGEKKITEAKYSKLIRLRDSSWLCLYKGKYGIIDNEGNILVEPKFTQAQRFIGKYAKMGYGGLYALYDDKGNAITNREYSSIDILYGKMFLVGKNYKYGLITFDGDILLAPIADDIYMPKPNVMKILYDGVWYEIEQQKSTEMSLPFDLDSANKDFKITQIIQNPIDSAALGAVSASDYFIKIFSSISPAYEKTIDELILEHGADTATILIKSTWLLKFPFVYGKNYMHNFIAPNNGPLSDVKANLKNKIK